MKQAIEEGYILDVVKHVYPYNTLYNLNTKLDSSKEYPPQLVNRGIRLKVYENDLIIQDKCERIAKLFNINSSSLRFGIFTESDVKEIGSSILRRDSIHLIIGLISSIIEKFKSSLTEEKRNEFRTLMSRFIGLFNYINNLYKMPNSDLIHYQLFFIFLSKKMDNQDYSSLKKELESVFVQNFDVIAKDKPEIKQKEDDRRDGGIVRNSGGATSVKKLKTVQQVVQEINEKFMKRVGMVGMNIIEEFMNKVSQDIHLQEIIRNNINNKFDIVYKDLMKPKLLELYHDLILNKAPDEYEKLNSEDIVDEVFHKAYDYIREQIKVA